MNWPSKFYRRPRPLATILYQATSQQMQHADGVSVTEVSQDSDPQCLPAAAAHQIAIAETYDHGWTEATLKPAIAERDLDGRRGSRWQHINGPFPSDMD